MNDQIDLEHSSQLVEEEQDFFLDDDSVDHEKELVLSQEKCKPATAVDKEESFRHMLAGPSSNKAGLGSIDKEQVNKIIYEASKGSAFFEREKLRNESVTKRINVILAKYELIKHQNLSFEERIADNMIRDLEESRDLTQCICHVDMDAFYASVEELENPELKNVPMAVGDVSMLCTSNYIARTFGVRSAMPGFIALKLCPQLKLIPLHFPKYIEASNKVRDVFRKYDPNFLPMSLDEAYLNLTEYLQTTDMSPSQLVEQIRKEIFESTQLTASAGIACNRTLSKICSDINKPNGQYYLPIDSKPAILNFVKDLRIRQFPGVGRVTERVLESLGVTTCSDIYPRRAILYKLLSPISFQFMLKNYLGLGSTSFSEEVERKSISCERTFSAMSEPTELFKKLSELSLVLEKDLEKNKFMGRNIGIKLKSVSYEIRIRSKTMPSYIWTAKDIEKVAKELLQKELPVNIRLMGLRMSTMKKRGHEDESLRKYFTKLPLPESSESSINCNETDCITEVSDPLEEKDRTNHPLPLGCPICNRQLVLDNVNFNQHVDECLNKVEVKEILKTQLEIDRLASLGSSSSTHRPSANKRLKR
ncbi:hypothetical protein BD770DRAFT_389022 [Pilaira anomala]|nr:hypothetical protein BD770DRAFT_389022 [Pilaira anomala]